MTDITMDPNTDAPVEPAAPVEPMPMTPPAEEKPADMPMGE